jgi:LL-diaminopimelate aminotransferase
MLKRLGFAAEKPRGSFFLYVPAPKGAKPVAGGERAEFENAEAVAQWLITEHLISTVPWDEAGAFLRFSVTFAANGEIDEQRVIAEMERRLSRYRLDF